MIRTQTVRCQLMLSIKFASGADLAIRQGCRRSGDEGGGPRCAPVVADQNQCAMELRMNCGSQASTCPGVLAKNKCDLKTVSERQHAAEQLAARQGRRRGKV